MEIRKTEEHHPSDMTDYQVGVKQMELNYGAFKKSNERLKKNIEDLLLKTNLSFLTDYNNYSCPVNTTTDDIAKQEKEILWLLKMEYPNATRSFDETAKKVEGFLCNSSKSWSNDDNPINLLKQTKVEYSNYMNKLKEENKMIEKVLSKLSNLSTATATATATFTAANAGKGEAKSAVQVAIEEKDNSTVVEIIDLLHQKKKNDNKYDKPKSVLIT